MIVVINQSMVTDCNKPTVPTIVIWSVPVFVVPAAQLTQVADVRVHSFVFERVRLIMRQGRIAVSAPHVIRDGRVHVCCHRGRRTVEAWVASSHVTAVHVA